MMTSCEDKYDEIQEMLAQERHDEATSALEQIVTENDGHVLAHYDLGNLYYATGRMDEALIQYEKTAALAPEDPNYLKNLADLLYSENKDVDRAILLYEKILAARPEDIQTLMITGHLCVSLKRFDDALGYYNRILDIEPWNGEAQQFVDRIVAQGPDCDSGAEPDAAYQRCQELVNQGDVEQALAGLESLTIDHPEFAMAFNDLGVLYYQRGDKSQCVKSYETAVSIDPENATFKKNLADYYLAEQGDVERALEIYLSVLKDNPEDIDALMVAGHICAELGQTDSAGMFYDRILDVEPWNLEASERQEMLGGLP
ncbi:MAG: tetratricopeptide repeat protein [Nitrospinales bacterium]